MKILRQATEGFKHWWVDLKIECDECKALFQLEESDDKDHVWKDAVLLDCPHCYNSIKITRIAVKMAYICFEKAAYHPDVWNNLHPQILEDIEKNLIHYKKASKNPFWTLI